MAFLAKMGFCQLHTKQTQSVQEFEGLLGQIAHCVHLLLYGDRDYVASEVTQAGTSFRSHTRPSSSNTAVC